MFEDRFREKYGQKLRRFKTGIRRQSISELSHDDASVAPSGVVDASRLAADVVAMASSGSVERVEPVAIAAGTLRSARLLQEAAGVRRVGEGIYGSDVPRGRELAPRLGRVSAVVSPAHQRLPRNTVRQAADRQ